MKEGEGHVFIEMAVDRIRLLIFKRMFNQHINLVQNKVKCHFTHIVYR